MKDLNLSVFPKINKSEWLKLAESQLRGDDPREKLQWKNQADISLEPYYDSSDLEHLSYLEDFFSSVPSHRWKLYERIKIEDPKEANRSAIQALMGGCDGIIFEFKQTFDEDVLMKDIDAEICDISFIGSAQMAKELEQTTGMHIHPRKTNTFQSTENQGPVEQIFEILSTAESVKHIHRTAFPDFFLEIASIRALRYLLSHQPDLRIHTNLPRHSSDEKQWFLNTTAGLATILGGSHSVDFFTATGDSRISRNTGNLIREESGIDEYTDACGGSYYIEVLTDKIIKEVAEKRK